MSRLAKKSIKLREGVTVSMESGALLFKGAKGMLRVPILPFSEVKIDGGMVEIHGTDQMRQSRTNAGTMWSLAQNAARGVVEEFSKVLEIEGIGYRASLEGDTLVLTLGYVQPVRFKIPEGVSVRVEKNAITLSSIDKQLVGETAARIRALKKPEPYKGKGIRYQGEVIRRKAGKKATTTAA